jgi:hypothetical protein
MENKLTIVEALNEIMKAVGGIAKKDRNQAQGFNFRGIDSVVNAVSPALQKFGVVVFPTVEDCSYETVEIGRNRTAMGHVRVRVSYTFIALVVTLFARQLLVRRWIQEIKQPPRRCQLLLEPHYSKRFAFQPMTSTLMPHRMSVQVLLMF